MNEGEIVVDCHCGNVNGVWWARFLDKVGEVCFPLIVGGDALFIFAEEVVDLCHVFHWY